MLIARKVKALYACQRVYIVYIRKTHETDIDILKALCLNLFFSSTPTRSKGPFIVERDTCVTAQIVRRGIYGLDYPKERGKRSVVCSASKKKSKRFIDA